MTVWPRSGGLLAKTRGWHGHKLGRRLARIQHEWPSARFYQEHGLHRLLGTIGYPGSPNAA